MADFLIVARANLNLVHGFFAPVHIHVEQYDGNWNEQLQLTLYNGADLYEIPNEVASVVISGTKKDNTGFSYYCTWDGAVVFAPLMKQMTLFDGFVPANITLFDSDGNQLSTAVFVLDIEPSALPAPVLESSNDFQAFIDYVNTAEYYKMLSQSFAVGDTGIRTGEDTDNAEYYWNQIKNIKGSPLVAATAAAMTEHDRVYVYTGSETGYTSGNWYYWSGSAWTSGGTYNAQGVSTDDTLTTQGAAADAKAVGDAFTTVNSSITALNTAVSKAYKSDDTTETSIDSADYIPFYDTSASAKKKISMANFSTGGSTITVRTSESDLYGKSVTITDGSTTVTRTFSNSGVAVFSGVTLIGDLTVSSTGTSQTAKGTISINYYSSYTVILRFWSATVTITGDSALSSATVTVTDSANNTVGTVILSSGTGTFTALYPDTYTFSTTYSSEVYSDYVVVTEETTYTVELATYVVYGFHIDGSESDPASMISYAVQYSGNNVRNYNFTPAHYDFANNRMDAGSWNLTDDFFIPRSCMLKYDGTVDYYLSENNEALKADGVTASDVANTQYGGNAMMEWGRDGNKIWVKCVPDNDDVNSCTYYVSNEQLDSGFKAYNFYDAAGHAIDHFYTAKYNGSAISSKLRSISGQTCMGTVLPSNEIVYATANNVNGSVEWYAELFGDRLLINILLMMIGKSTDTQAVFGMGNLSGSGSADLPKTGAMNGRGQWYGTLGTSNGVKVFGMENYWGHQYRRTYGFVMKNGALKYKLTYGTTDGSSGTGYNLSGTGYKDSSESVSASSNGYLKKFKFLSDGAMIPVDTAGSSTTYYCDTYTHQSNSGEYCLLMGGMVGSSDGAGAFFHNLVLPSANTSWQCNTTLSCKPLSS